MTLIYGTNAVINLLKKKAEIIKKIYILKTNKHTTFIKNISKKKNIPIKYINIIINKKLSYIKRYNSVICKIEKVKIHKKLDYIIKNENSIKILILDKIQDPYNLASCIRTAEAFSINTIITNEKYCINNTAIINKISNGAIFLINIYLSKNIEKTIIQLKNKNIKIIGMSAKAKLILSNEILTPPIGIIMGSEKNGIKNSIKNMCDFVCKIPLNDDSKSINVSVATGITLSYIKN